MNKITKFIPEVKKLKEQEKYNNVWNNIYNIRRKVVNESKAIHSANAIVYAEILKDFIKG